MRQSAGTIVYLFAIALLFTTPFAQAQNASELPDAPSPIAVSKAPQSYLAATVQPADSLTDVAASLRPRIETSDFALITDRAEETAADQPGNFDSKQGAHIDLTPMFRSMNRPSADSAEDQVTEGGMEEHYHWKGLLWESFAFFGVENAQRLMADYYFRHLTADSPFWHDYIASLKHWNWRRWNDGDDFLVAYIGHPMQGSVTEFIEIQNDPRGRSLRIGDGKPYWKSQFHAFLWATAYSFDQKLGPLGEAALGSEGGYTYVLHCPVPCPSYRPGIDKVTNNTGIVKLVTTPVGGSLWTMMEDGIDRVISDRLQDRYGNRVFVKIVRGSLNPCRTMANFLRWRLPWYRDDMYEPGTGKITRDPHWLPGDDAVILKAPRFEIYPHYNAISLPVAKAGCTYCRVMTSGFGVGFSTRLATYADLDSDVDYQPNASPLPSDRAGGNLTIVTVGLRSGYTNSHFAIKASLRPGILSYSQAYQSSPSASNPTPTIGRITHFATSLALNGDYFIDRHLALRVSVGNTAVRYREPYVVGPGSRPGTLPYLNWLSKLTFLTNENWAYQTGVVMRF